MTEWTICDVCGCKYAQAIMPNGKPSKDKTCLASKIDKNRLGQEGDVWSERMLKHNPEWADLAR